MLVELIVSLFGIAIVYRNLSLVEKFEVISAPKLRLIFCFLQLPFCFFIFFKELITLITIYIGIFSITLILNDKIFAHFNKKTFEKLHFNLIDRLILLLNTGKSAQTSVKIVFAELNAQEKRVFADFNSLFEHKNEKSISTHAFHRFYFDELKIILRSSANLIAQLRSFREALRLQNNLRHRSGQVLQQTRAQAMVATALYAVFFGLSVHYLALQIFSFVSFTSLILFLSGQAVIFRLGGRIRWKT